MVNIQVVRHKQRPIPTSPTLQHIQLHSTMHVEVLGRAWRCLGTSRSLYRVWIHIHGQTNMTTYGIRFCIWTSGGPQTLKHIAKHPLTLCHVYRSIWKRLEVMYI